MVVEFFHSLFLKLAVWSLSKRETPKFRKWIELETQKNKVLKAVEESSDDFPNHLFAYLSTALCFSDKWYRKAGWEKVVIAFYTTIKVTQCQLDLPLLTPDGQKINKEPWDYPNRPWHSYVHLLAKNYGWSEEYIGNLSVSTALSKVQEILIDDQLTREFQWTMSERSSYYDTTTKTAKLNPLPRPSWMHKHIDPEKELKKVKIPTGMLPAGNGISLEQLKAQASQF